MPPLFFDTKKAVTARQTNLMTSVDPSYNNPLNQQPIEGKGCATGIEELKVGNFLKISNAPPQYNSPEDMNAYWGEVRSLVLLPWILVAVYSAVGVLTIASFSACFVSPVSPVCSVCFVAPVCVVLLSTVPSPPPSPSVWWAIHSRNTGPRPRRARQTIRHVDQRPGVSSGI